MLNILCALLDKTMIYYEKIAENEISIPASSLRVLKGNADSIRTDSSLNEEDFVWIDDEVYIHISEEDECFSMFVINDLIEGE